MTPFVHDIIETHDPPSVDSALVEAMTLIGKAKLETSSQERFAAKLVLEIAEWHGVDPNGLWMDCFWEITPRDVHVLAFGCTCP